MDIVNTGNYNVYTLGMITYIDRVLWDMLSTNRLVCDKFNTALMFPVLGINPQEFDNQTLAVLRGRLVRYLMRSKEVRSPLVVAWVKIQVQTYLGDTYSLIWSQYWKSRVIWGPCPQWHIKIFSLLSWTEYIFLPIAWSLFEKPFIIL